ncbi:hypothetical protein PUNSTDRAFT_65900 [Punctularia strigosozonata HHB-11173 SS5]|uniref:uncharacterized protein n=1 Tax=Punctularia strigosozonata (strain HHB-11173) TaxID=741275 RepID=UPI00044181B2|nr:uncharacterized protein PUNSTDRAFT_65900 [Punctularia strigosozonata HHB-11173 SS5]EIN09965.1 hypothetical protein PUNSTDRAFT_65900 [Punctularia strigosozonata HHB-11173 SS5]
MIIPINVSLPTSISESDRSRPKLPPRLVKLGDANSDELVLIELQGELETEGVKDNQVVGTLKLDENDKPTLMIGYHLLEGKLVNLSKPLAVLHLPGADARPSMPSGAAMDVDSESNHSKEGVAWNMVAIVKRKIVFSKRPMPIVGLGSSASSTPASVKAK